MLLLLEKWGPMLWIKSCGRVNVERGLMSSGEFLFAGKMLFLKLGSQKTLLFVVKRKPDNKGLIFESFFSAPPPSSSHQKMRKT
jgi:hypothetical protein